MNLVNFVKRLIMLLPILEIVVFIIVGNLIGILATLLLIFLTSALGSLLLRGQGFATLSVMQQRVRAGESSAIGMMESSIILLSGFLLFLPGFITDTIGLLCLVGPIRHALLKWVIRTCHIQMPQGHTYQGEYSNQDSHSRGNTIEGESWKDDDPK